MNISAGAAEASPPATTAVAAAPEHFIVLDGATWADYQRLLELRGERSVPRISFLEGRLELMTPSHHHEYRKSALGCLIEAWCYEQGVDFSPYGSWTLESKEFSRGAEPDECYVIGEPSGEPARPDLAIEVIWTSGGISKLEIYRKLGVPELWFWQGGKLSLYALRGEDYQPIDRSEVLVGIDHRQLEAFVELTPVSRAVRSYLAALREVPVRG